MFFAFAFALACTLVGLYVVVFIFHRAVYDDGHLVVVMLGT
jgi:hypothetical protein